MSDTFDDDGPPPGLPIYHIFCPHCERHGEMAVQDMDGMPGPPESFICFECGTQVERLERTDQ